MSILPDIGFPQTCQVAVPGLYACMNCPHDKEEDEATTILYKREKLPECPVCGVTYWMKV